MLFHYGRRRVPAAVFVLVQTLGLASAAPPLLRPRRQKNWALCIYDYAHIRYQLVHTMVEFSEKGVAEPT